MNAGVQDSYPTSALSTEAPEDSSPTILCIDDDPNISEAIGRALHRRGIDVLRAYDGMQGYWQAVTRKPQVIILDLSMPNGDGTDVLEALKRNSATSDIPVIVLSGKLHPSLSRHLEKQGVVRCFAKPMAGDELLAEIGRHLPAFHGTLPNLEAAVRSGPK